MDKYELISRLKKHEGETFKTKTGAEFAYNLSEESVIIIHHNSRNKTYIKIDDISSAIRGVSPGLSELRVLGYGRKTSYIYAIIHDPRII